MAIRSLAHIGKPDQQQPRHHARRRLDRHRPGDDGPAPDRRPAGFGSVVPPLPGYRTQELEISALYPHRRHLSAKVRAFVDMLVDRFAELQRRFRPATV